MTDKAGIGFAHLLAQQAGHFRRRQRCIELRVVQFVITKSREELKRPVAGQLPLIGITTQATRAVLTNRQTIQPDQHAQRYQSCIGTAAGHEWCLKRSFHRPVQCNADPHSDHREQRNQRIDRVRLEDVVDHLFRVNQVVHGDKVEPHAELIPKQPFGNRRKQHRKHADADQAKQQALMPAPTP